MWDFIEKYPFYVSYAITFKIIFIQISKKKSESIDSDKHMIPKNREIESELKLHLWINGT